MPKTYFDLPNAPDQISVNLNSSKDRRIDFSGLDFDTAMRGMVEYIRTYYPDLFNDFTANNGMIMMMEIIAGITGKMALRGDINAMESVMALAKSERAVEQHLKLIGAKRRRQTAAAVDVEVSLISPLAIDMVVPAGTILRASSNVQYELFKAPDDYTSDLIIPAGKRGIIGFALHGTTNRVTFTSIGDKGETFTINSESILETPILVNITSGDSTEAWLATFDMIEKYGPNDKVAEATISDTGLSLRFGDDVNGKSLTPGQQVEITYRTGGGVSGRIGANQLSSHLSMRPALAFAAIQVTFNNPAPSYGGSDKETLEEAKKRGPREYSIRDNISGDQDYVNASLSYSHPVFGKATKAVAAVYSSKNANLVRVYVLTNTVDGQLGNTTLGLKQGLKTRLEQFNVLTDEVEVLDGGTYPVDLDMAVIVDRVADATTVKGKVDAAVNAFFDVNTWKMGQPLYISNLIQVVKNIDGVTYVDLYKPVGNVLTKDVDVNGVDFNEVIVLRNRQISYYYDRNRQTSI